MKTLDIDTGDDPHSGLFGDKTQASTDPGSMNAMGRLSIGGMDMAEDDKTLFFINLKDRKVYSVFIDSPAGCAHLSNSREIVGHSRSGLLKRGVSSLGAQSLSR